MDLSVVIASYNTREITSRCLEAILEQTEELEYEIIVVDNGSSDGSAEMIETSFPSVKLIRNEDNLGFAAAQNIGLCNAKGNCFLILNSDAFLVGNAAKLLVDHLYGGPPELGVVGPQILNPDGSVAPSARRAVLSTPIIMLGIINRHFKLKHLLPSEALIRKYLGFFLSRWHDNYASHAVTQDVDWVDGMCVLIKREVLEETGLFDEQFFIDSEIVDLCNRIRARGWTVQFFPGAQAVHFPHSSRKQLSRAIVETHRSELIYYAKYAPQNIPIVKLAVLLTVFLKAMLLRLGMIITGADDSRREALVLYSQIFRECRGFRSASAWSNERIPILPPKLPEETASLAGC